MESLVDEEYEYELPSGANVELTKKLVENNNQLWVVLWSAILFDIWYDSYNKNLHKPDSRGRLYAQAYFLEEGLRFVKQMTDTDLKKARRLILSNWNGRADQLVLDVIDSYLCSTQRLQLILRSEIHKAVQGAVISAAKTENKTMKQRHCMHQNSCLLCIQLDGETVPIDSYFSDGTFDAHTHIGCRCQLEFK